MFIKLWNFSEKGTVEEGLVERDPWLRIFTSFKFKKCSKTNLTAYIDGISDVSRKCSCIKKNLELRRQKTLELGTVLENLSVHYALVGRLHQERQGF
jgi:hypothetical protein